MADPTDNSFTRRPYEPPSFTRRLVSDVRSLLRKASSQPDAAPEAVGLSAPLSPVLLVENFEGDAAVLGKPAHSARAGGPIDASELEAHWVEMYFEPDPESVSHEPFLLLDLRGMTRKNRGSFETIDAKENPNPGLPMVILVHSLADLDKWSTVHPSQCWQLHEPSAGGLIFGLQSFFDLCGELRRKAPPSRYVPDRVENYVFAGQARKPETHR
jgi:hypothetical protein